MDELVKVSSRDKSISRDLKRHCADANEKRKDQNMRDDDTNVNLRHEEALLIA
jgi:hypothetical protein